MPFNPIKNEFVMGSKVLMFDGSVKNIEDISVGDKVVNSKTVVNKIERNYSGNIARMKMANSLPISCTNVSLNKGDVLFAPVLTEHVESDITVGKARLLGLFAAEGSFGSKNRYVVFSFGKHEYDSLAKSTVDLIKKEFRINAKLNLINEKSEVAVYNKNVALFFKKHVGSLALNKKLSREVVFGEDINKIAFISGWLDGDGSVDIQSGKIIGTTISSNLSSQVRVMLNSLKINNTLNQRSKISSSKLTNGRIIVGKHKPFDVKVPYNESDILVKASERLGGKFNKSVKFVKINRFVDNYRTHKVLNKEISNFAGPVFNLEIEDGCSYVVDGVFFK